MSKQRKIQKIIFCILAVILVIVFYEAMKKRKENVFKIRTYLNGIIWLALACSMIISALLFAFLKHFLEMPENIPAIVWLLIFNTMIAGLIIALLNGKVLAPITKLSEAMKDVSQGDFDKQLEMVWYKKS